MNPYFVALIIPILIAFLFRTTKSPKRRGLPVEAGGDPGFTIRNSRFTSPVESSWEGVSTIPGLFEKSCNRYSRNRFLGSREVISREMESAAGGRTFEKLHLGDYKWISYDEALEAVIDFASGLVNFGHEKEEPVAIFADTCAEWQIALQVMNLIHFLIILYQEINLLKLSFSYAYI